MNDDQYLGKLGEVAKWLDSLINEVNSINETLEDLIAEAPVSASAWDKVGNQIWSKE